MIKVKLYGKTGYGKSYSYRFVKLMQHFSMLDWDDDD